LCCVLLSNSFGRFPTRYVDSAKETSPSRCMLHDVCLHVVSRMLHVARRYEYRVELLHPMNPVIQPAALLRRCCVRAETASQSVFRASPDLSAAALRHTIRRLSTDLITATTPLSMVQTRSLPHMHARHSRARVQGRHRPCAPAPLAGSGFAFGRSLRRPVIPTYRCNADRPSAHSTAAGSQHRPRVCVRVRGGRVLGALEHASHGCIAQAGRLWSHRLALVRRSASLVAQRGARHVRIGAGWLYPCRGTTGSAGLTC
jgi:hypothetical protein